ncbi:hypothetical protein D3C72_1928140 [compost metagenome]
MAVRNLAVKYSGAKVATTTPAKRPCLSCTMRDAVMTRSPLKEWKGAEMYSMRASGASRAVWK